MENKVIKNYSLCGIVCKPLGLILLGVELSHSCNNCLEDFARVLDERSKSDTSKVENEVQDFKKQSNTNIFSPQINVNIEWLQRNMK